MEGRLQYKRRGLNFAGAEESRRLRMMKKDTERRDIRKNNLLKNRNIILEEKECSEKPEENSHDASKMAFNRKEKLKKWKEERTLLRKLQSQSKKPVFKVAAVTHDKTPRMSTKSESKILKKTMPEKEPMETRRMTRSMTAATKPTKCVSLKPSVKPLKTISECSVPKNTTSKGNNKEKKKADKMTNVTVSKKAIKSFAPENFTFMVPGNLVNFTWEPTPLTPRTSQQFIFSSGSSIGESDGHEHEKLKLEILTDYKSSGTSSDIDFASLKPKYTKPKTLRTPAKASSDTDKESPKPPRITEDEPQEIKENTPKTKDEDSITLSMKYFQPQVISEEFSTPLALSSTENTPFVCRETAKSINFETPKAKNEIFDSHCVMTDAISRINIEDTPTRKLRSGKKVSLLFSPAQMHTQRESAANDLMSFSPAN